MARWSFAVRLRDYYAAPRAPGIYEVGFIRSNIFSPKYIGRAVGPSTTIYSRLSCHYRGLGNEEIDSYLKAAIRDNLWTHWIEISDPAYSEALLLNRFSYDWNKRLEFA